MSIYNHIQIRLKEVNNNEALNSVEAVINHLEIMIDNNEVHIIEYSDTIDRQELKASITKMMETKQDEVEVTEGFLEGCYGARTGKQLSGLSFWLDARLFDERFLDDDGDEIFNFAVWLDDYATETDLNAEDFLEAAETLGLQVDSGNSYNYEGNNCPYFVAHINYRLVSNRDRGFNDEYLVVKFHCGGDPRGNYTVEKVFKVDTDEVIHGTQPDYELRGELSNYDAIENFKRDVLPSVVDQYGEDDTIAINEAFNNYTDELCKDGLITDAQYEMITFDE